MRSRYAAIDIFPTCNHANNDQDIVFPLILAQKLGIMQMYSSRFLMLFIGLEQDGFHISMFPIPASEADLFIDTDVLVSSLTKSGSRQEIFGHHAI